MANPRSLRPPFPIPIILNSPPGGDSFPLSRLIWRGMGSDACPRQLVRCLTIEYSRAYSRAHSRRGCYEWIELRCLGGMFEKYFSTPVQRRRPHEPLVSGDLIQMGHAAMKRNSGLGESRHAGPMREYFSLPSLYDWADTDARPLRWSAILSEIGYNRSRRNNLILEANDDLMPLCL